MRVHHLDTWESERVRTHVCACVHVRASFLLRLITVTRPLAEVKILPFLDKSISATTCTYVAMDLSARECGKRE